MSPQQLIEKYALQQHPEGGWYKETYRISEYTEAKALPASFTGNRAFSTAIYFYWKKVIFLPSTG